MKSELREIARTLASLTEEEYREVTSEARGPAAYQLATERKAEAAADMSRKASQLAALIQQSHGF